MDQRDKLGRNERWRVCWAAPTKYASKEEAEAAAKAGCEMLPSNVFVIHEIVDLSIVEGP